jgi:hypothetical protein
MVLTLGVLLRGFFISRTSPQRMIQSNLFGIRITNASRYSPAHVPDIPNVPDVPVVPGIRDIVWQTYYICHTTIWSVADGETN